MMAVATIQARHQGGCALGSRIWTKGEPEAREGCTCAPTYYLVTALKSGGRNPVGKSYTAAKKAWTQAQAAQDRGEELTVDNRTFATWAGQWYAGLKRPKESTLRGYVATLKYAKKAFGDERLRKVTVDDVRKFLAGMTREVERDGKKVKEPISNSTQAKHLRVLSHCFRDAMREGLISVNPVDRLGTSQRPQAARNEAPYFTDDELPRLIAALPEDEKPLIQLALLTGMRLGELLALRWSQIDLVNGTIHVRQTYVDGIGATTPKSDRGRRDVELMKAAETVLAALLQDRGVESDDALLFSPRLPTSDGYRRGGDILRRVLYPAMERAGMPREGLHLMPPTESKRTFHSLRHTYARIALENGAELSWLSRQMGHATASFTEQRYGHWSKAARKREVAKLDNASAFGLV
jgi:integrase